MTWYAAHIIIAVRPIGHGEKPIAVYENIVLIEAVNADEARVKARNVGRSETKEELDDGLTIDGMAAQSEFIGVRKLVTISNPSPLDLDNDRPVDGTEITYLRLNIPNETVLDSLAQGGEVEIVYVE